MGEHEKSKLWSTKTYPSMAQFDPQHVSSHISTRNITGGKLKSYKSISVISKTSSHVSNPLPMNPGKYWDIPSSSNTILRTSILIAERSDCGAAKNDHVERPDRCLVVN
ncbi:hypothetical protein I7I48_00420 [Histoplasma ohiense]|nr:hypothetical protein I7I48_00420 [Histoplasma ohiense (nom. inval.)]